MIHKYTNMAQNGNRFMKKFSGWLAVLLVIFSATAQAQTGPGGVGNADGSSGQPENVLWLDARTLNAVDGSTVSAWPDASGNGHDLGVSGANNSGVPTFRAGSFNYLEFNEGEGDRLVVNPLTKFPDTQITTFILYRTDDNGEGILSYDVSGGGNEYLLLNSGNLTPRIKNNEKNTGTSFQGNNWSILNHAWKSSDGAFAVSCRFRANHDITIKNDLQVTWQENRTTFEIGDEREVTVDIAGNLSLENGSGNNNSRIVVKNDNRNGYEHTIKVGGDITVENVNAASSTFDLYNGTGNNNNAILELSGEGDHSFTNASGITPDLYRVVMNKGGDTTSTFTLKNVFTLSGTATGPTKALELKNGLLIFDYPDFGEAGARIDLADDTTVPFIIPPTAGLEARQKGIR